LPILVATFSLALGASNYAVQHALQEEKVTIRASYTFAFRHIWRHLGILFLQALLAWVVPYLIFIAIAFVGGIAAALLAKSGDSSLQPLFIFLFVVLAIAMVVAAIVIWLRFSLAFAATTAEDKTVWPSMQRSAQLSKGTRGRIFVMFLMVGFLGYAVTIALLIPLAIIIALAMQKSLQGPTPPTAFIVLLETAYMGIAFLVRAFVMPIYTTSLQLFYYDQRIRQEGYDIEMLMAQAGWSGIALPPPPPAVHVQSPFQPIQPLPFAPIPPPPPGAISAVPEVSFPELQTSPGVSPEFHLAPSPDLTPESVPATAQPVSLLAEPALIDSNRTPHHSLESHPQEVLPEEPGA
jgi:hypothetical protein